MHTVLLWACYLLAQLLHMTVKAGQSAANKFTPWGSVREYVRVYWPVLLTRFVLGTAVYLFWWDKSTVLAANPFFSLPLNYGTSIIYGWFSDSVLAPVLSALKLNTD